MKKLFALLVISIFLLCGCSPIEEESAAPEITVDYSEEILGTWYVTLTASEGTIEGPMTFHTNGTVSGSYGDVTAFTDNGPITERVSYGENQGIWTVDGNTMHATGGQGMDGTFTDTGHMSGTIIDNTGATASWIAVKIAPYVVGEWTMNIEGWGDGETARFQSLYLNEDGTADTDWVKVQTESGETNEGEITDYLDYYSLNGDNITIYGEQGSGIEFTGILNENGEIEGTWTNSPTAATGTWYAVSMD